MFVDWCVAEGHINSNVAAKLEPNGARPSRGDARHPFTSAETTFADDTADYDLLAERLAPLIDKVWSVCEARDLRGRTVTLKVKFSDFTIITRSRSNTRPVSDRAGLEQGSLELLRAACPLPRTARLIGVSVSGFQHHPAGHEQLGLIE